jgi:truncated hemoglobin YjbI
MMFQQLKDVRFMKKALLLSVSVVILSASSASAWPKWFRSKNTCQPVCTPVVVCCEPAPVVCCQPAPVVCCEPAPAVVTPAPEEKKIEAPTKKSLYERLGGEPAVKAVVDDFVGRAASNPKVNFTRKGTAVEWEASPENVARLKKLLIELIGSATGGPQKYTGRDMKSSHKGMMITEAEFGALAGDLKATLDKFKVPQAEQDELFKIVGSTKGDIVEKK